MSFVRRLKNRYLPAQNQTVDKYYQGPVGDVRSTRSPREGLFPIDTVIPKGALSRDAQGDTGLETKKPDHSYQNESGSVGIQGTQHVEGNQYFYFSHPGIRAGTSDSTSDQSLREDEKICIEMLRPHPIYGRESSIKSPCEGTLAWLGEDPIYKNWAETQDSRTLLLTGHPGCGKSVMLCYIAKTLLHSSPHTALICRHFLDESNRSLEGCGETILLRSLIFQIVIQRQKLLRIVRKKTDWHGSQLFKSPSLLWDLFDRLIKHERVGSSFLIIDALDHCDTEAQRSVIAKLSSLLQASVPAPIKVLISSRPDSQVLSLLSRGDKVFSHLRLEQLDEPLAKDVDLLIQKRLVLLLDPIHCSKAAFLHIQDVLMRRAERTFLWVSLALDILENQRFLNVADVEAVDKLIPAKLEKLYGQLFDAIPMSEHDKASKILHLVTACARTLTIAELNVMSTVDRAHQAIQDVVRDLPVSGPSSVPALLGPLVKVSDFHVSFVHSTVKEYLLADQGHSSKQDVSFFRDGFDTNGHSAAAECCMHYLLLANSFYQHTSPLESPATLTSNTSSGISRTGEDLSGFDIDSLQLEHLFLEEAGISTRTANAFAHGHELYDYAARYWSYHYTRCRADERVKLLEYALRLCHPTEHAWLKYLDVTTHGDERRPIQEEPLLVASFLGLHDVVDALLFEGNTQNQNHEPSLYWAARQGHSICLQRLLACPLFHAGLCSSRGESALTASAKYGHYDCVDILLQWGGFNVNESGPHQRTALSLAAAGAHQATVSRLLVEHLIDVNIADDQGSTPLFWAVGANSVDTVRLLLRDHRTDAQHLDHKDRSALSWACSYGAVDIAKALAQKAPADIGKPDHLGKTPLMYAINATSLETVKLLIRTGDALIFHQDINGRNAMSWAAECADYRIARYIMRHAPESAAIKDGDGWLPLAWTLNPPGYLENARILLERSRDVINEEDARGRSLLVLAICWSQHDIARLLISTIGIDLNHQDATGRTALSHAAAVGDVEIVRQLLTMQLVKVSLADKIGRTPLEWAQVNGQVAVRDLLSRAANKPQTMPGDP